MSMGSKAFKSFIKRNVEDYNKFKQKRLEAKDEYFYRDLRTKPHITERSRKIVRSISAQRASQFGIRPWTHNADRTSLNVTTKYSLANQTLLNRSLKNMTFDRGMTSGENTRDDLAREDLAY